MGVRDERYKLISYYDYNAWELYDLKNDPHELNNVYEKPAYTNEVKRLKARLTSLMEEYQEQQPPPPTPRKGNHVKNNQDE